MNNLIIFDLDNTIINGDSDRNWGQFLEEEDIVEKEYLKKSELYYDSYHNGDLDIISFLNFCVQPLKNNPIKKLIELRNKFIEKKIKPIVLDKAKNLIMEELKNNKVIIATATNSFVTEPIARLFHIEDLVATEFEIKNDVFTGKVIDVPCFHDGKLLKVKNWAQLNGYDLRQATFYSDSINDLPLLNEVGRAIIVDGDDALLSIAEKNNWECISFR